RLIPPTRRAWTGAMHSPIDGTAEPALATTAIAALARAAGAVIVEHCAVRGIERAAGRVSALITERGRVNTATVLIAAGAWSRLLCGNLDANFPQLKIRGSVLRTTPIETGSVAAINGK